MDPKMTGTARYWVDGQAFDNLNKPTDAPDTTSARYWLDGKVVDFLVQQGPAPTGRAVTIHAQVL